MGVKLMDLRGEEKLQAIAPVVSQVEERGSANGNARSEILRRHDSDHTAVAGRLR